MKKFILKIVVFVIVAAGVTYLAGEVIGTIIDSTGYNILNNPDHKIKKAIINSRQKIKCKYLVIGESVSAQLYGDCHDSVVYSLSASVAIRDVGEYLLLSNFFENNKAQLPNEVIMIFGPTNYFTGMAGGLFYGSFMKNFYNSEFIPYMDDSLKTQIEKQPFSYLCLAKGYQYSPYIPDLGDIPYRDFTKINQTQYRHLLKIRELCLTNGVKFRLLAGPTKQGRKQEIDSVLTTLESIDTIFYNYRRTMRYLPDSCYVDGNHMKPRFIPIDYLNLYN